jgi:cobalt/nickel transport system permease protein
MTPPKGIKIRLLFLRLLFFTLFFGILILKESLYLAIILGILFLLAGKKRWIIGKKVIGGILLFNSAVSIGYLIFSWIKGINPFPYLVYINLKVFTLTFFVFFFFSRVNLLEFFAFSRELSYLLTITISQILTYRQLFHQFRLAFKSRVVELRKWEKEFIKSTFLFFLEKALKEGKERSLAMKSRGFFEEEERKRKE